MNTNTKTVLSGGVLLLHSSLASANLTNQGILDQVVTDYATRAASWQHVIIDAASWLFWTLVVISMVWTFGMMARRLPTRSSSHWPESVNRRLVCPLSRRPALSMWAL